MTGNRWLICIAAILVQLALGGVYAWSVFSKAMRSSDAFGWSPDQAALPFTVCIGMIFLGAFLGGRIQDRRGPRVVALTGGVIYSIGVILASFAGRDSLWLLILGYGVLGGFGLGMAYIVPIAMLQKWFPDKPGLITGLAVGGFGFGAVITAPVGQSLIAANPGTPTRAFLPLGVAYLVAVLLGASLFKNPPKGCRPPGMAPTTTPAPANAAQADPAQANAAQANQPPARTGDYTVAEALRTPQWYLLTAILALSVLAGISFISVAAGSAGDIANKAYTMGFTVVGIIALVALVLPLITKPNRKQDALG